MQHETKGFATEAGTRRYAGRAGQHHLPPTAYRILGRTQWTASALGFGCYRIDDGIPEHSAALKKALREGCNLIDTSTNYVDGGSEVAVGKTVAELVSRGELARDEVIVVSKVGYVQGSNLEIVKAREAEGHPYEDVVKYTDGCWHCIHPKFIEDQLTLSLGRLGMERVDVYLLHNPEYFFSDAQKRKSSVSLEDLRVEFYRRIGLAFTQLEKEVQRGRIGCYGVSSNQFGGSAEDPETTSISRMCEMACDIARKVSGDSRKHHFSVVQLPLNLFESGPALEKNTGEGNRSTALDFARENGFAVLVNRPLNAFVGNQLVRLADPEFRDVSVVPATQAELIRTLEEEFRTKLAPSISTAPGSMDAKDFFRWGKELSNPDLEGLPLENWDQIESQMVVPQVSYLIGQLDTLFEAGPLSETWTSWRNRYQTELMKLLGAIRNEGAKKSAKLGQTLAGRLDPFLPQPLRRESLSRKALAVLLNTPGVSSVLNGMRRPRYVDDSMGALKLEPFKVSDELYKSFQLSH